MSKHTPGPWRQEHEVFENGDLYRLRGSREEHLGDLYGAHRPGEEGEYAANARLIAAAPELLAALEQVNDCLVKCLTGGEVSAKLAGKAIENAAIVIAQAKGEQP